MTMQLPLLVCAHQTVNYSIIIINTTINQSNDNSMTYIYTSYFGPYFHIGAGIARQRITSGLERDKEYSVIVNVWTESQTVQSNEVLFSELDCMISMFSMLSLDT